MEFVKIRRLIGWYCCGDADDDVCSSTSIAGVRLFVDTFGRTTGGKDDVDDGEVLLLLLLLLLFFVCRCFSCFTSISISLLWRISARDVGIEPVKFVDFIPALFDSEIVEVRRELFVGVFGAKNEQKKTMIKIILSRSIG